MLFRHHPNQYCIIPTRTPAATLSLAAALDADAPKQPPAAIAKRLARMAERAEALQSLWNDVNRPIEAGEDPRPRDFRLDRAWAAIRDRIAHWVTIDHPTKREAAEELGALLFPAGLDFTNLPYAEQWAESERRVVLIDEDGLFDELADLVDPRFVDELHEAHKAYGEVLGTTKAKPESPDPARVGEALAALREELSGYARLVIGLVDQDDADEVAAAEAQLAAMIRYRKPRASAPGEEETETESDALAEAGE